MSVDAVLFTYHEEALKVLLVKRSNHPELDKWGLPGGFVDLQTDQCLEETAVRKIQEKTGIKPPYVEQLETIGNAGRDKRGWSVTICYSALIAHQECEVRIDAVSDAAWFTIDQVSGMELAFEHIGIIWTSRERLKQKALYSIVPAYALPDKFTLSELQHVHEVLIGKKLQKKSFRRRVEQADLLLDIGEKRSDTGRPASLYAIKSSAKEHTFIRNLEV